MAETALLLIHGMGKHAAPGKNEQGEPVPGEFEKQFKESSTQALQRFEGYRTDTVEKYIDLHEVNYDAWFDEIRKKMADQAQSMEDRLGALGAFYGVNFPLKLVETLRGFEADFGSDEFFYTHWLDVIFYATLLGNKVQTDVAKKISDLVGEYGPGKVHIMAHSLGTAVLHDTLHRLYRNDFDPDDDIPDLGLVNQKLQSIWMVANVSRLVYTITGPFLGRPNPYETVVKPGDKGCCINFYNVRHELDPFTRLARFSPQDYRIWVPGPVYDRYYNEIETRAMVEKNPHSFTQYSANPRVAKLYLLEFISEFDPTAEEIETIENEYDANSLQGVYSTLKNKLSDLNVTDTASRRKLLETARKLWKIINGMGGES